MSGLAYQGVEVVFGDPVDDVIYYIAPNVSLRDLWFPEAVTNTGNRLREMRGMYRERERHEWRTDAIA